MIPCADSIQRYSSSVLKQYLPVIETSILNYQKYIDPLGTNYPQTNVNGWHSQFEEFPFFDKWAEYLRRWIQKCYFHYKTLYENPNMPYPINPDSHDDISIFFWFNINQLSDFNFTHDHVPNKMPAPEQEVQDMLSGVFYVNEPGDSFYYINENQKQIFLSSEPGDMLIFPVDLKHGIASHGTEHKRITIAFNIFEYKT